MKISDHAQGKKIVLSQALDSRAKILNIFYFASCTAALWIFLKTIADEDINLLISMLFLFFTILYGVAAYRFINKAMMSEIVLIDTSNLQLIKNGFFTKKIRSYDPKQVRQLFYLERKELTKHPLAGESFDYFGFQTQQQMINELHGDDKISFEYEGKKVSFGENLYSWDFEELEKIFREFCGTHFRFNEDFEKIFKFDEEDAQAAGPSFSQDTV